MAIRSYSNEYLRSQQADKTQALRNLRSIQRAKVFEKYGIAGWTGRALADMTLRPMGRAGVRMGRAAWEMKLPIGRHSWRTAKGTYRGVKKGIPAVYRGVKPVVVGTGKNIAREYRFAKGAIKHLPVFSAAFAGYEISQGKNLAEGLMRGGVEVAAIQGATIGAKIGAGIGSIIPGVGTVIGGLAGGLVGYMGVRGIGGLGFEEKGLPVFENVYQNRRAATMRQASQMHLAKSSRAAFGNEASIMHLR